MKKNAMSLLSLFMAAVTGGLVPYVFLATDDPTPVTAMTAPVPKRADPECAYRLARVEGYDHVRPLLYSEPVCESPRFEDLRASIATAVEAFKAKGQVNSASVYVRDFRKEEWTWYNGNEPFDPGSMLKIPLLLTYLSMSEEDPGLMDRAWTCERIDAAIPLNTAYPSASVALNVSYTVSRLLEHMIVHSDDRATAMLMRHVPPARLIKTYTDLGLPAPEMDAKTYRMNVRDHSVFMKALYNAALLSPIDSERALEMMTRAEFRKGLVAGLPEGVDVAHNFGGAGDLVERQLHETGLVYADDNPYLITVMTRGPDVDSLASVIASLSKLVYERMRTP